MSKTVLEPRSWDVTKVTLEVDIRSSLERAWGRSPGWVLGHAHDGLLWGFMEAAKLTLAADHQPGSGALLRAPTLLDLRIFDERRELRAWRAGSGLEAVLVLERDDQRGGVAFHDSVERDYVLLGKPSTANSARRGFALFTGDAGQQHHVPVANQPPRFLRVRHYYKEEPSGWLRMAEHRLVALTS